MGNIHRNNSAKDAVELVHVHEVLGHLCGEHQVDHGLPDQLEGVPVEALEYVDPVVGEGELEGQSGVVVLEDCDVVVEVGQLGVGIAEKGAGRLIRQIYSIRLTTIKSVRVRINLAIYRVSHPIVRHVLFWEFPCPARAVASCSSGPQAERTPYN